MPREEELEQDRLEVEPPVAATAVGRGVRRPERGAVQSGARHGPRVALQAPRDRTVARRVQAGFDGGRVGQQFRQTVRRSRFLARERLGEEDEGRDLSAAQARIE